MEQLDVTVDVYQEATSPDRWVVEVVQAGGNGFLTIFVGPEARGLAVEYASVKFKTVTVWEH